MEEFLQKSSLLVQIIIMDRLIGPFNLLLERGKLNISQLTNSIDESLWVMARWLEVVPNFLDPLLNGQFKKVFL